MNPSDLNPELTGSALPTVSLAAMQAIKPQGRRLNIMPTGIWMLIDLPDQRGPAKVGTLHMPKNFKPEPESRYAEVNVLEVGPAVANYKKGDRILVERAQCDIATHFGHQYTRVNEGGVVGIILP